MVSIIDPSRFANLDPFLKMGIFIAEGLGRTRAVTAVVEAVMAIVQNRVF